MNNLKNIWFLFPVMAYYLVESFVAAIVINLVWKFILLPLTGIPITFLQWVAIIWIIKVVFFDVFKLLSGFISIPAPQNNVDTNTVKEE